MTTITQTITALPTAPNPVTQTPDAFDAAAAAFVAALGAMVTEENTWAGQANTVAGEVSTNATNAAASAAAAAASETAAIAAAGASAWVSGQAYVAGNAAYSLVDFLTYRANTSTSGTTDPSLSADWELISGNVTTTSTQTLTNKTLSGAVLNDGYTEEVYALGTTGALTLEPDNGSIQTCALTGNPTFSDGLSAGQSIVLMLTNGASYTVTWPTMTWVTSGGNVAPTLTAADTLVFWKVSTTLYGAYVGSYV